MKQIYRTVIHPEGCGGLPDYEIRGDGQIYRTVTHQMGWGEALQTMSFDRHLPYLALKLDASSACPLAYDRGNI